MFIKNNRISRFINETVFVLKNLEQKFSDEAFNHFGSKIKTVKVE